jgi:phage FluMu gp28-like protein
MTLDPSHFLPYQRQWIECPAPLAIGQKARRIGWTYASAYRAVQRRVVLGTDLFYTSADLGAAREFVEECQRFARVFDVVATDLGEQAIDEHDGLRAFVLRFKSGARIVAGSSNPKFFRGKGGDADADEFAFHADPRGLFKAMHATAMVWGHQLRLWSTHNGEGSYFNRMCAAARGENAECGMRNAEWENVASASSIPHSAFGIQHFRVSILDAVEQGLVERIKGLSSPDPVARRDWLEALRASCPDEDAWREEYLCEPSSEQSALLTYEMIAACETQDRLEEVDSRAWRVARKTEFSTRPTTYYPLSPASMYAGFDVGRKRDRSVLWVLVKLGDVYHTRRVRVMQDTPFSAQEDVLHELLRDTAVKRLCIDATGIGAMLAERLKQRWRSRVEAVQFTSASKSEIAMPLVRLFQVRLIRIPADPAIREDLHKVRRVVTASGNVRLDAARDEGGHADRFWALALVNCTASTRLRHRCFSRSASIAPIPVASMHSRFTAGSRSSSCSTSSCVLNGVSCITRTRRV